MSTDTPTDQLASTPGQELVMVASRTPGSRWFHEPHPEHTGRSCCGKVREGGQLVPRWYAVEELGRRPHPGCFSTQEDDTQ